MKCILCGKRIWWFQKPEIVREVKDVDDKGIPLDFINPHEYDVHSKCCGEEQE